MSQVFQLASKVHSAQSPSCARYGLTLTFDLCEASSMGIPSCDLIGFIQFNDPIFAEFREVSHLERIFALCPAPVCQMVQKSNS